MTQLFILAICLAITAGIQLSGFAVAFALQTEKFYDILGGVNFIALVVFSAISGSSTEFPWSGDTRKIVSSALFTCSRGWLLLFLAWRAHERGGDGRFDGVKDKFAPFLVYWIVQGVWVMVIALPQVFINSSAVDRQDFTASDYIFIVGFGISVCFLVLGDVQKTLWVRRGRIGGFCRVGVWAVSRHPNYFGEIAQWWFSWAFAFASGSGVADAFWWACILSPLVTMQILLNLPQTGIWNAEGQNLKRYYEKHGKAYQEYRDSTSILIPMVGYKFVPHFLKRTVFLDFQRYEYKPEEKVVEDAGSVDDTMQEVRENPNDASVAGGIPDISYATSEGGDCAEKTHPDTDAVSGYSKHAWADSAQLVAF